MVSFPSRSSLFINHFGLLIILRFANSIIQFVYKNIHTPELMGISFYDPLYKEQVPGIISCISCFFVIITYLLFRDLRDLRYVELVFYVTINDLLASIGISLGKTPNGSFECWFQGITTNFNYLSSIFWTTIITYQVNIYSISTLSNLST